MAGLMPSVTECVRTRTGECLHVYLSGFAVRRKELIEDERCILDCLLADVTDCVIVCLAPHLAEANADR